MANKIKFPTIEGAEFYLVGGSVRDYLLNIPSKDLDFVVITDYSFDELVDIIKQIGVVFQAKEEFLTIRCKIDGQIVDIAFPRNEHTYSDGRRPDVVNRVKSLKEDAERRDFTINSLYMDKSGEIIDLFDGRGDLQKGIIRAVGDPDRRFSEDYLRILRALRFSVKLGFRIERNTQQSMRYNAQYIINIEANRIREEINKALLYDLKETISLLTKFEILDILKAKKLNFQLTSKKLA